MSTNYADLPILLWEVYRELLQVGAVPGKIRKVKVSEKLEAEGSWGTCTKHKNGEYTIRISRRVLDHGSRKAAKGVLMHELIHTLPDSMHHGSVFMAWARKVNDRYGYKVENGSSTQKYHVHPRTEHSKYRIRCSACEREWGYDSQCEQVKTFRSRKCPCGGSLELFVSA